MLIQYAPTIHSSLSSNALPRSCSSSENCSASMFPSGGFKVTGSVIEVRAPIIGSAVPSTSLLNT